MGPGLAGNGGGGLPRRFVLCRFAALRGVAPQLEFQLPAPAGVVGADAMHLQRADLGERGCELHRNALLPALGSGPQYGGDRWKADEVAVVEIDQFSRPRALRLSGRVRRSSASL